MAGSPIEIWVFVDIASGRIEKPSLGTLSEARRVAVRAGGTVTAICCCDDASGLAESVQQYGAEKLIVLHTDGDGADSLSLADTLAPVVAARRPRLLLFPSGVTGRELAARIAARTDAALVTLASWFHWNGDKLIITQPQRFGSGALRLESGAGQIVVATLHAKQFPVAEEPASSIRTETRQLDSRDASDIEILSEETNVAADMALDEVDVIVAGGLGVGESGFTILRELASVLNGRVAASRMVTDRGWADNDDLIGQTGTTVAPTLYIACGISGAPQHLIGMRESDTIISINTDKNAPIGDVADLLLVGDAVEVLPRLIRELRDRRRAKETSP